MENKTLAQLKRDLKVGTRIVMTFNAWPPMSKTALNLIGVERTVSVVQSNQIKIATNKNGEIINSYLEFPPAIRLKYTGDTFDIYDDRMKLELSYKIIT